MVLKVIAVTGATGMLGRHVSVALRADGFRVLPCSRSGESTGGCSWDLTQWKSEHELDELFDGVDAVVHAGAAVPKTGIVPNDGDMFNINVRACINLAEWARKRGKPIVYISSATVYADPNRNGIQERDPLGCSGLGGLYGMTKLLGEDVLRREEQNGMQLAVLRPSSTYGAGLAPGKMLTNFLKIALQGGAIELMPPVEDRIDFVHAADVADAVVCVLRTGSWETFNIGSERLTSIIELAETCVRVAGRGEVKVKAALESPPEGSTRFGLSCARAKSRLGWESRIGMLDGIRTLLDSSIPRDVERAR